MRGLPKNRFEPLSSMLGRDKIFDCHLDETSRRLSVLPGLAPRHRPGVRRVFSICQWYLRVLGYALYEKGLQRQAGVGTLVSIQERRALLVPRLYRGCESAPHRMRQCASEPTQIGCCKSTPHVWGLTVEGLAISSLERLTGVSWARNPALRGFREQRVPRCVSLYMMLFPAAEP